jgi:hypothetical protein
MELLNIVEIGGYPDFSNSYKALGINAKRVNSMRKGLKLIKKEMPDVIVAEFNFQTDFRDRSSNLESLMAVLQPHSHVKIVVFYESKHDAVFNQFSMRFDNIFSLVFPIKKEKLIALLSGFINV